MLRQAEQIVAHSVAAEEGKTPVIITESSSVIRENSLVSFYLHTVSFIYVPSFTGALRRVQYCTSTCCFNRIRQNQKRKHLFFLLLSLKNLTHNASH